MQSIIVLVFFVSPIYTFSSVRDINFLTSPSPCTKREKYFNLFNYKGKIPNSVVNKHLFITFSLQRPHLFHVSTETVQAKSVKMDIKVPIPASALLIILQTEDRKVFPYYETIITFTNSRRKSMEQNLWWHVGILHVIRMHRMKTLLGIN